MIVWIAILLTGCTSDTGWQGATGVGNPGSTKQSLGRSRMGITSATVPTDLLFVDRCSEDDATIDIGEPVDLLDDQPVEVPGGLWCGFVVEWSGPLRVEGVGDSDEEGHGTFELELELVGAELQTPLPVLVDEDHLIFELGYPRWLDGEDLGLEDGEHVAVGPGDPMHDELVERIELGSGLYVDADGDGVLSDAERANGTVAAGPEHDPRPVDHS